MLFIDPPRIVYIALIIVVALLAGAWLQTPSRRRMYIMIGGGVLLLAFYLLDRLVDSPREQGEKRLEAMAKSIRDKKYEDVTQHLSEKFEFHGLNRTALPQTLRQLENYPDFEGVEVFQFERNNYKFIDDNHFQQGFTGVAKVHSGIPYYVVGSFERDSDGQFRLSGMKVYNLGQEELGGEVNVPLGR